MAWCAPGSLEPPARKPFSPSLSPLPGTTTPQRIPNHQMNTENNIADGKTQSMDHHETRTIAESPQTESPDHRARIDLQDQTSSDGEEASIARASRRWSRSQKRVATLIGALVVCVAAAFYYLRFIAPFESTDDAFIEGHVTQVAPQVAGRIARVLVNDNQFVNAGEVLVQIEPSDYEAKLAQVRANLASAKSRLGEAGAQLTVDLAKVEQEKANVMAAEAEANRAEADAQRYQAIGTSGVSQSQIDLST